MIFNNGDRNNKENWLKIISLSYYNFKILFKNNSYIFALLPIGKIKKINYKY